MQSVYCRRKKLSKTSIKKLGKLNTQKKSEEDNIIKNIRNLLKIKKENETIKDRMMERSNISCLFL